MIKLQFHDSCHIQFVFSWLCILKNQTTNFTIGTLLFLNRIIMWTPGTVWGTSQEGDFTARALDYLWTSQRLRGSQDQLHPICSAPVLLPCLLPSTRMGGFLPHTQQAKEMHFTQSSWQGLLQGNIELNTKSSSAVNSLHTHLSSRAGVRMGQECGLGAREQAGHQHCQLGLV